MESAFNALKKLNDFYIVCMLFSALSKQKKKCPLKTPFSYETIAVNTLLFINSHEKSKLCSPFKSQSNEC